MSDRTRVELESYERSKDRFWEKVDDSAGPNECWLWTAGCNPGGYGNFQIRRNGSHYTFTAPRWVLGYLRRRPLVWTPGGEQEVACHHCDNPPCCNPAHLYVGTQKQNIGDASRRLRMSAPKSGGNGAKTHCAEGHPFSGENLYVDAKRNKRECRACGAARARRYRAERRAG